MTNNKTKMLGVRIRKARTERGFTQEQLAERVNVGATHISHIETGQCSPSVELLIDIMEVLEVAPNKIFGGTVSWANDAIKEEREYMMDTCDPCLQAKINDMIALILDIDETKKSLT